MSRVGDEEDREEDREEGRSGLAVRDVVVHYRDDDGSVATAVDHLDLDVPTGEVVALLGPSGSGKSSLLRAVAGLEPLSHGRVTWDGADLAGVPTHRRGFGLMFQDGQLFPQRDVAGNVGFGLRMARVPARERAARVRELLALVGLEGFERRPVTTLSGGERQRVALARSLGPRPRLLLLDEPLSALDRALRERLASEVRDALVATGTTALFVTHDHDEAFAVADRVAVMDLGRLLQVDAAARLWQRPADRRVAQFLGYQAFAEPGSDAWRALGGDAGVRAGLAVGDGTGGTGGTDGTDGTDGTGGAAALAIGPGSLEIDAAGPLSGVVRRAGFRRGVVELVVDVAGLGEVSVVERLDGRTGAHELARPGSAIRLRAVPGGVAVVG